MKKTDVPDYDDSIMKDSLEDIEKEVEIIRGKSDDGYMDEEELPKPPEQAAMVLAKYRTEPDIPVHQADSFDEYRGSYGRHVALSNTRRSDNLRHLDALDLMYIYDSMPTMRHRADKIRIRETGEFQMCRSNEEIGGFEAKIGITNIRRENVDLVQTQNLPGVRKRSFLGRLFRRGG